MAIHLGPLTLQRAFLPPLCSHPHLIKFHFTSLFCPPDSSFHSMSQEPCNPVTIAKGGLGYVSERAANEKLSMTRMSGGPKRGIYNNWSYSLYCYLLCYLWLMYTKSTPITAVSKTLNKMNKSHILWCNDIQGQWKIDTWVDNRSGKKANPRLSR